jgi:DNA replicative helicase MCM subunit Mcm2 (Cdc46/Mcm family)
MNKGVETDKSEFSVEELKKYLCYAKMKVFPRLSEEASHMLQDMYVSDRM